MAPFCFILSFLALPTHSHVEARIVMSAEVAGFEPTDAGVMVANIRFELKFPIGVLLILIREVWCLTAWLHLNM